MISEKIIKKAVEKNVRASLEEDIGKEDLSASLIENDAVTTAVVVSKSQGILCGKQWFEGCFLQLDPQATFLWHIDEGHQMDIGSRVVDVTANCSVLLTAERSALNLLQTLSGTCTTASQLAKAVINSDIVVLDTRKTLPGLRIAQKYAVWVGGCSNHRLGLWDSIIIKENHIVSCGSISKAVNKARELHPDAQIVVEAESVAEVKECLSVNIEQIMLDEIPFDQIPFVIDLVKGKAKLEISGGLTAEHMKRLTGLKINFVSVGALTKNLTALDFSMRIGHFTGS